VKGKGQCYKVVTSASLLTISKLVVKTVMVWMRKEETNQTTQQTGLAM
jgi:hypothetical protein